MHGYATRQVHHLLVQLRACIALHYPQFPLTFTTTPHPAVPAAWIKQQSGNDKLAIPNSHPAPRSTVHSQADTRADSVAISVGNISQFAPSYAADMELRQQEAALQIPAAPKLPPKGILAKSGGVDKNPAIYKLPDILPEHLTIQVWWSPHLSKAQNLSCRPNSLASSSPLCAHLCSLLVSASMRSL